MRYQIRKKGKNTLKEIEQNLNNHLIIHYSCESFTSEGGKSPRITCIAIYIFESRQVKIFSLTSSAEELHINIEDIPNYYDKVEKHMLDDYFGFMNTHSHFNWIHWNMRSSNYGFYALEHRYKVLDGQPTILHDSKKIDLASLLVDIYGENYIEDPKMISLMRLNGISEKDFMSGLEEGEAFNKNDFFRISMSCGRKVHAFASIIDKTINNNLKVRTSWKQQYGTSFQSIYEMLREKWWWSILTWFIGLIIGYIIS